MVYVPTTDSLQLSSDFHFWSIDTTNDFFPIWTSLLGMSDCCLTRACQRVMNIVKVSYGICSVLARPEPFASPPGELQMSLSKGVPNNPHHLWTKQVLQLLKEQLVRTWSCSISTSRLLCWSCDDTVSILISLSLSSSIIRSCCLCNSVKLLCFSFVVCFKCSICCEFLSFN